MAKSRSRRRPPPAVARNAAGAHKRPLPGPIAAAENWHRQALAAHAAKSYPAAIEAMNKAIALRPDVAVWHTHFGAVLRTAGQLTDAIAAHRRAIALDPGLAAAHNNLGNALRAAKQPDAAEAAFREAFRLEPRYAEAYGNLAQLLREQNRLGDAEAMCQRALELRPDYPEVLSELGHLLEQRADFAGAERCFRTVCERGPSNPEAWMRLGGALEGLGQYEEADRAYDRAIALAPDQGYTYFARARRLEQTGDSAAAADDYRRALTREPRLVNAYLSLANLPGRGLSAEDKHAIEALLAGPDLMDVERSSLYFALARAAERERDWDAAFGWARTANELDRARTSYDEAGDLAFVHKTIAAFPSDCWAALPAGSLSERPVFIIGMPRSGTTLVEQIIASHPQAAAGGELVDIPDLANQLGGAIGSERGYPDCVLDLNEAQARQFAQKYLERLNRISDSALRITDKLPFNFRHLGLITALFPKARIIHCRRDPRDIAVSCYFIKFHRPISFACDLFELGTYLRHYQTLMAHWRGALPQPMLEIQYEELVAHTEREARRLIDFCGLPWDDRVLDFHQADRAVRTASANQVRRPIYASSIGRWQRYAKHLVPLYAELEDRLAFAAPGRRPGRAGTPQPAAPTEGIRTSG